MENKKFIEEKEKKLKKEVEKVKSRHDTESISFQMKMTASVNEFKKNRTVEYERLIQRFKNKIKATSNPASNDWPATHQTIKPILNAKTTSTTGKKTE